MQKEFMLLVDEMRRNHPVHLLKDKGAYADWLAQTYYFVCHSTKLLGLALPYLKSQELRHRFEKHIGEEERHELMCLKDLDRLKVTISDFPEHPETQAFYQSQYYRIQFESGTSLLGYILYLEGMAVYWGKELYDCVKPLYPKSMVFLHVHTTEDPGHLEQALTAINGLPEADQDCIRRNLYYSHEMYQRMLDKIVMKRQLKKAV